MKIISLVGFKNAGKDTVGGVLARQYGFRHFSFASSLKDSVAAIFSWDRNMLEGATPEGREWRETVDTWWAERLGMPNLTPRWVLQYIGTDVMRRHFHDEIWISSVERKLTLLGKDASIVITDGRFPNEFAMTRKYGGKVIRVRRGTEPEWFAEATLAALGDGEARRRMREVHRVHESEWAWVGTRFDDSVENDGTIEELEKRALALGERLTG